MARQKWYVHNDCKENYFIPPTQPLSFNQKSQIPACQNILNFQTEPSAVPSKMYLGSLSYICDGEFLQKH